MIEIRSKAGLTLQFDGSAIELELNNWLLADGDDLPGSFSYPVSFPLSDSNKAFLEYRYLPEARPQTTAVSVSINGMPLRRCTLGYRLEKDKASGYLKLDAGEVASQVKGRYLHQALTEKFWLCSTFADAPSRMLLIAQAEPGVYPITFFPVNNPAFSPDSFEEEPLYQKRYYINHYAAFGPYGTFTAEAYQPDHPLGYHIVPFVYLTYLIEKVCAFFGYQATGSFLQHPDVRTWVLDNTQAIESVYNTPPGGRFIDLGMHVPYITIPDFLRALRDDFGLGIYFDSSSLEARFELFEDTRRQDVARDLTPYLQRGYDNEVPDEKGFVVRSYTDDRDELYKNAPSESTTIRSGQKDIKASIGTLAMLRTYRVEGQSEWLVPTASQKGNLNGSVYFRATDYYNREYNHKNPFGLRLLSYRGFQEDSAGNLYPYATSISRNFNQERLGSLSLAAAQSDSTYRAWTLPFYYFLAYARTLRYDLLLPLPVVRTLRLHQRYTLRGENSVLTQILIKSIVLSLPGAHGQIPAKASVIVLLPTSDNATVYSTDVIYVELLLLNPTVTDTPDLYQERADIVLRAWADAARTVPANPTSLLINYRVLSIISGPGAYTSSQDLSISLASHEYVIDTQRELTYREYMGEVYEFESSGNYEYTLLSGSGYVAV